MTRRHRAAVVAAPRTVDLVHPPLPEVGPTQVRLRLEGCGVCGSNLPVWEGRPWFTYPLKPGAPGHEGWGVVDAIGEHVNRVREGDRVAALSYEAFADHDVAEQDQVVPLPSALEGQPFPGEALGCAMNVFRRSAIVSGQTVAVVGVGFLGALLVNLVWRAGGRVIAVSRRPFALAIARRMGAEVALGMEEDGLVDRIKALTGGRGCERVIEATGLQQPLDLAGELTAEGGRLVIAGYHQDGLRTVNLQLWNWRGLDVINAHERDPQRSIEGVRAAAAAVAHGALDPTPLYTHRYPLADLGAALEAMRLRPDNFLKALLIHA